MIRRIRDRMYSDPERLRSNSTASSSGALASCTPLSEPHKPYKPIDVDEYETSRSDVSEESDSDEISSAGEDDWWERLQTYVNRAIKENGVVSKLAIVRLLTRPLTVLEFADLPEALRLKLQRDSVRSFHPHPQRLALLSFKEGFDSQLFLKEFAKHQKLPRSTNPTSPRSMSPIEGEIQPVVPRTLTRTKGRIDIAAEELVDPSMQGWLWKQGGSVKTWRRRWFVLKDYVMYYFTSPQDISALGMITLPSYLITTAPNAGKKFAFQAEHTGMRTFLFYADSNEDMETWLKAMRKAATLR